MSQHTHKFLQIRNGRMSVWRCEDGDCNFILYKKKEALLIGRNSHCWNCDKIFPINEINLQEDRPTCVSCRMNASNAELEQELLRLEEESKKKKK